MNWLPTLIVVWAGALVTLTVLKLLSLMDTLDTTTSTVATLIIGILTGALGFYIRNRELNQVRLKKEEVALTKARVELERVKQR